VTEPQPKGVEADLAVLRAYGMTMLRVQLFERNLAALVAALERGKLGRSRDFKSAERFAAHLDKLTSKMVDLFQRASAKRLLNMLPADFDPALGAEISALIPWRDRLAHRYLFEKLVEGPPGSRFQPDTMRDRTLGRVAEFPESQASPEMREEIESRVRAIVLGEFEPPE
jgi:hypothetical protein